MCGILGAFSPKSRKWLDDGLPAGITALKHRGPDDHGHEISVISNGFLGLGHTRLSIIDLSAGGHQPMHSLDQRFSLIYNGEIYNYKELRDELVALGAQFRSDSDTEVLLTAWAHWGTDCLTRLSGMFAFVIVDRKLETLTCVRDAFGIKPFFYGSASWGFCFGSELPATVALRGEGAELNLQRTYDYLVHGDYDSRESTFVEGIQQLEPGTWRSFDMRTAVLGESVRWWTPRIAQTSTLSFDAAADHLRELFIESVRQQMRSDVPLGAALSGGIDSSAVVCVMRHVEPDVQIHTFSFIAKNSPVSEEDWMRLVNAHVGAAAHSVTVEPDELARDLDDMIRAQGEPFGSTSIYAQYRVFELAKQKGITVTLDGQGADEILAGYQGYPGKRIHSLLDEGSLLRAFRFVRDWGKWPGRSPLFGLKAAVAEYVDGPVYQALRSLAGDRIRPAWIDIEQLEARGVKICFPRQVPETDMRGRRLIAELGLSATRRGLPALLRHADRNSMRFSVESRVPFLSTKLAQFLFSLPEEYLLSDKGETKRIFRAAMRGIVPDAVLDRRDKIGFATPEQDWLMRLAEQARKWLREDVGVSFLHQEKIVEEFDRIVAGEVPFSWQAWRWINFWRWHVTVFQPLGRR
jgi:asparagine synthase (glutamine-hydrolysing)